ncbi:unnamed protein product, partial [Adineta steineri]
YNTTVNSDYNINITNLPGYKATLYQTIHVGDCASKLTHSGQAALDSCIEKKKLISYAYYLGNIEYFKRIDGSRNPMIHKDIFREKTVKDIGKDNDKRASLLNDLQKKNNTDNYSHAIITACYLGSR